MTNESIEYEASDAVGGQNEPVVMREGYCCSCDNCPKISIVEASKKDGSPCNGCWFSDDKPNWKPIGGKSYFTLDGTFMNGDGTRSIFDDVDA